LTGITFYCTESDEEDEVPTTRRRMAERAAEGGEDEDVKVQYYKRR